MLGPAGEHFAFKDFIRLKLKRGSAADAYHNQKDF